MSRTYRCDLDGDRLFDFPVQACRVCFALLDAVVGLVALKNAADCEREQPASWANTGTVRTTESELAKIKENSLFIGTNLHEVSPPREGCSA